MDAWSGVVEQIELSHRSARPTQADLDDDDANISVPWQPVLGTTIAASSARTYRNYVYFSQICAIVPACAISCLALATSRLGSSVGAWQSGILYASYTLSSVIGISSWTVYRLGSRNGVLLGQILFGGGYVICYGLAVVCRDSCCYSPTVGTTILWIGTSLGGIGAAILWTSQGAYFSLAAERYAEQTNQSRGHATALLASIFAFWLIIEEALLSALSTMLVALLGFPWSFVFVLYGVLVLIAICAITRVDVYDDCLPHHTMCGQMTATLHLLYVDRRMKYMIGFNAAFAFAGAFLNSFIAGQVVPVVTSDSYVGLLSAWHTLVGAGISLIVRNTEYKGSVLLMGSLSFLAVAMPFLWQPILSSWTWSYLLWSYTAQGIGRGIFESTWKSLFADWFFADKTAAFSNITLQDGLASTVAYIGTARLLCRHGPYCVTYRDGSNHQVGILAGCVVVTSVASIMMYHRAACLPVRVDIQRQPLERNDDHDRYDSVPRQDILIENV